MQHRYECREESGKCQGISQYMNDTLIPGEWSPCSLSFWFCAVKVLVGNYMSSGNMFHCSMRLLGFESVTLSMFYHGSHCYIWGGTGKG